jgi:hypothetical protein
MRGVIDSESDVGATIRVRVAQGDYPAAPVLAFDMRCICAGTSGLLERDINVTGRCDDQVPGNTDLVSKHGRAEAWRQRDPTLSFVALRAHRTALLLAPAARHDSEQKQSISAPTLTSCHTDPPEPRV